MTPVLSGRIALCAAWLLAFAAGIAVLFAYESGPGKTGHTPAHWPSEAPFAPDPNRDTLVMFAHPRCPCTRATMEELNRLLAAAPARATVHVCFFKPENAPAGWPQTSLWRTAAAMPDVSVHEDVNGALAERFGALTSGFVALYDAHGDLLFKGGITAGRGHAGENPGEQTLVALLNGKNSDVKQAPVYGCSLACEINPTNTEP